MSPWGVRIVLLRAARSLSFTFRRLLFHCLVFFFFSGAFIRTQRICDEEGYTMVICPIARENSFKLDVASYSND